MRQPWGRRVSESGTMVLGAPGLSGWLGEVLFDADTLRRGSFFFCMWGLLRRNFIESTEARLVG